MVAETIKSRHVWVVVADSESTFSMLCVEPYARKEATTPTTRQARSLVAASFAVWQIRHDAAIGIQRIHHTTNEPTSGTRRLDAVRNSVRDGHVTGKRKERREKKNGFNTRHVHTTDRPFVPPSPPPNRFTRTNNWVNSQTIRPRETVAL